VVLQGNTLPDNPALTVSAVSQLPSLVEEPLLGLRARPEVVF
jgi:hypothetical protein